VAFWTAKVLMLKFINISFKNFNVPKFQRIISLLPESCLLPKDQLTDKPERFFVNETIREKSY
jgi:GTP-binding protein Era